MLFLEVLISVEQPCNLMAQEMTFYKLFYFKNNFLYVFQRLIYSKYNY